jgi:hypothetical protein
METKEDELQDLKKEKANITNDTIMVEVYLTFLVESYGKKHLTNLTEV